MFAWFGFGVVSRILRALYEMKFEEGWKRSRALERDKLSIITDTPIPITPIVRRRTSAPLLNRSPLSIKSPLPKNLARIIKTLRNL